MENVKLSHDTSKLVKIELNDNGDYIVISADDPVFFDKFQAMFVDIMKLSEQAEKDIAAIEKEYAEKEDFESKANRISRISRMNVEFSKEACSKIEGVFGEGVLAKYFYEIYNEIPNFLPDGDCILDFIDQITPAIETIFNRKMEAREKLNKKRMKKYQPQDFKKKQK